MKKWLKMFLDHKGFRKKTVLSGSSGIKLELTFGAKNLTSILTFCLIDGSAGLIAVYRTFICIIKMWAPF